MANEATVITPDTYYSATCRSKGKRSLLPRCCMCENREIRLPGRVFAASARMTAAGIGCVHSPLQLSLSGGSATSGSQMKRERLPLLRLLWPLADCFNNSVTAASDFTAGNGFPLRSRGPPQTKRPPPARHSVVVCFAPNETIGGK